MKFIQSTLLSLLTAGFLFACSSSTDSNSGAKPGTDAGSSTKPTADSGKSGTATAKPKAGSLKGLKGSTPPTGAKKLGKKSSPKVGSTTVPISDADVYLVMVDYDGDGKDDELNWANVDGVTYVWAEGAVTCDDGQTQGTAGFVAMVKEDGSGSYMLAVDKCPESSGLAGCDFDTSGADTTCGVCAWNDAVLACAAAGN